MALDKICGLPACDVCGRSCMTQASLQQHKVRMHGVKGVSKKHLVACTHVKQGIAPAVAICNFCDGKRVCAKCVGPAHLDFKHNVKELDEVKT